MDFLKQCEVVIFKEKKSLDIWNHFINECSKYKPDRGHFETPKIGNWNKNRKIPLSLLYSIVAFYPESLKDHTNWISKGLTLEGNLLNQFIYEIEYSLFTIFHYHFDYITIYSQDLMNNKLKDFIPKALRGKPSIHITDQKLFHYIQKQ
jgi:hypothetical protein